MAFHTRFTDGTSLNISFSETAAHQIPVGADNSLQAVQYDRGTSRNRSGPGCEPKSGPTTKRRKARGPTSRFDVLKTDRSPKTIIKKDVRGRIAGTLNIFGLNQVVRAARTSEEERATNNTRKLGACDKCKNLQKKCVRPNDPVGLLYEPCSCCKRLVLNSYLKHVNKIQYNPCLRVSLLELRLHRNGPTIRDDLSLWFHKKHKMLCEEQMDRSEHLLFLTQGFGEGFDDALCLKVSRFRPEPTDRLSYFWTDSSGQLRSMEMPPIFISDLETARQKLIEYTKSVRSVYIETLLADSNPIVRQTFQAALLFSPFGNGELVSEALDVWVASRLIEKQFQVFNGGAMLGMKHVDEADHPFNGFTPVTPIMDSQLDDLVIRHLIHPICTRFLVRLKEKIEERKRENWLEIYLAMFVMLSNMALIQKDMATQARRKGLKPGNRGGTLTQSYIHASKTMLAYFHFACAGSVPFSIAFDGSKDGNGGRSYHGMTQDQLNYLRKIQEETLRQETTLADWTKASMYEDELYWCYQLLVPDWRGDIPYTAGEIDDFREEDFLSSSTT